MSKAHEPIHPVKYAGDYDYSGLTIRQYFAAMAMQGLLANNIYHNPNEKSKMITVPALAETAVSYADALLK